MKGSTIKEGKEIIAKIVRKRRSMKDNGWTLGEYFFLGVKKLFTCEDEKREMSKKVPGETRIPAGIWELRINITGGKNADYKKRFPKSHLGMIEIMTPFFECTYIHIGNSEKDSKGCPLVGTTKDDAKGKVGNSAIAYETIFYPDMIKALLSAYKEGKKYYIEVTEDQEIEV